MNLVLISYRSPMRLHRKLNQSSPPLRPSLASWGQESPTFQGFGAPREELLPRAQDEVRPPRWRKDSCAHPDTMEAAGSRTSHNIHNITQKKIWTNTVEEKHVIYYI